MAVIQTKKTAYGESQPLINIFNDPVVQKRNPVSGANSIDRYEIGQWWVNPTNDTVWMLTSYLNGQPVWRQLDNGPLPGVFNWSVTVANPILMTAKNGYYSTINNANIIAMLPPIVGTAVGDEIWIVAADLTNGAAFLSIQCNAGQTITFDDQTSAGAAHGLITTDHFGRYAYHLVCTDLGLTWTVLSGTRQLHAY